MEIMTDVKDILSQLKTDSQSGSDLVSRAYAFAEKAHEGQTRYSGEPYFIHVATTARALAEIGMGPRTVSAGLLHDTLEDGNVSETDIRDTFGDEVLFLVQGVTKLGKVRYHGMQRHTESLRKLFVATSQDVRVLIIKLMDRLHNMQTLEHVPEHKQRRIALETLEVYAPIADRLGMGRLKRDLEDLSFPYAYPTAYDEARKIMKQKSTETFAHLEKVNKSLKRQLAEYGFRNFRTESRVKGLYSLYRKYRRKKRDIEKVYDISALRIIVPTVNECYTVLGVVHKHWRPLPGKIKDYIAFPKPNGYRSLHTTVFTGDGGIVEIQIRTEEMHEEAQYGIASHISYKEAQSGKKQGASTNLQWLRQFIPLPGLRGASQTEEETDATKNDVAPMWIQDLANTQQGETEQNTPRDFLKSLKADFFSHRIFVFTPKGEVIDLPLDSSPVDFAYAIHSDIGDHISGTKVNGKLVSLDTKLKNGDIVEIQTKQSATPKQKWLEFIKTSNARKHIRTTLSQGSNVGNIK